MSGTPLVPHTFQSGCGPIHVTNKRDTPSGSAHDSERTAFRQYSTDHGLFGYVLGPLYDHHAGLNARHFDRRLKPPHLVLGHTAPRQFAHLAATSGWGSPTQITLNAGLVDGTHPAVTRPWPAGGVQLFVEDLVLSMTLRQYRLEVANDPEPAYRGYGPGYCAVANRIGAALGLGPVVPRRRAGGDEPVAAHWPLNVRPPGYYGTDVRLRLVRGPRSDASAAGGGLFEYLHHLLVADPDRLSRVLSAQIDRHKAALAPALRSVEDGTLDHDGRPVSPVTFDPTWAGGAWSCVRAIAAHIRHTRNWWVMPILADALEDAGCDAPHVLAHCRAESEHFRSCWVLAALAPDDVAD